MLWAPYLFIVYFGPKVLKLLAVGVFGGVFLGSFLSLISLVVTWYMPGVPYIFSTALLLALGFVE